MPALPELDVALPKTSSNNAHEAFGGQSRSKSQATTHLVGHCYAYPLLEGAAQMSGEYSLSDVLERMYENQLALEAAVMELALLSEKQGLSEVGDNVRGALFVIGENAGHIKQGLAKLRTKNL